MSRNYGDSWQSGPTRGETGGVLKWGIWLIAIVLVLGLVGTLGSFLFGWFREPARIYGVDNVRDQWQFAYEYEESLKTIASNYCTAATAVAQADPQTKSARETQRIAQENNYNRVRAEYDARLRNAFEAKLVKPADVPERASTLQENVARTCGR
jgi:hypothetical protein